MTNISPDPLPKTFWLAIAKEGEIWRVSLCLLPACYPKIGASLTTWKQLRIEKPIFMTPYIKKIYHHSTLQQQMGACICIGTIKTSYKRTESYFPHLHVMWLLCLIIQLHHGLVWPDHTGSGGLPSTGHDDGSLSGWTAALTLCLCLASGDIKEADVPRMHSLKGTEEQSGGLACTRTQIQAWALACIRRGSAQDSLWDMREQQGVWRAVFPWGKISGWRERRAVQGEGLVEMGLL